MVVKGRVFSAIGAMDKDNTYRLSSKDGGDNARQRRLSAAVADPTGRRDPTKSIFAGMTPHTHTSCIVWNTFV